MKKNGTKPEKKKTPSYEEGKVRDPEVRKLQEQIGGSTRKQILNLLRKTAPTHSH